MTVYNLGDNILEKYTFISFKKPQEIIFNVFQNIFKLSIDDIEINYSNKPSEIFSNINERIKKILLNLSDADKIEIIRGKFKDGGEFTIEKGRFSVVICEENYNYELIDNIKNLLSPVFPMCILQNSFIWGVNLYFDYSRELLFDTRRYIVKSQRLEEPEIDIFRRDNGIIYKLRFHVNEKILESGDCCLKQIFCVFSMLIESIQRKIYEGLETLYIYCVNKAEFRRFEPRTKIGKEIKALLSAVK